MATGSLEAGGGPAVPMGAEVAFLLLDGLRRTRSSGPPEVVLCALGLTREGSPHPLALRVVSEEEERTWRALLRDLKADGIGPELLLICSDGHPALVKAIHATYPETPLQISVAHRLLALARKVDARWRAACLAEARKIFAAPDRATAVALFRHWHARWLKQGEFAVRSLETDLATCLTFYRFPADLWNKIRTVNLVERVFRDARRTALPSAPGVVQEWDELSQPEPTPPPAGPPHAADAALPVGPPDSEGAAADGAMLPPAPTPVAAAPTDRGVRDPEAIVLHVSHLREAEAIVLHLPPVGESERAEADLAIISGGESPASGEAPASPTPAVVVDAPAAPPAGTQAPNLSGDEEFEEWLQAYRRQALRMKVIVTSVCAAGLLTGLVLALGR